MSWFRNSAKVAPAPVEKGNFVKETAEEVWDAYKDLDADSLKDAAVTASPEKSKYIGALWLFKFGYGSNLSDKADKNAYITRARREFAKYKPPAPPVEKGIFNEKTAEEVWDKYKDLDSDSLKRNAWVTRGEDWEKYFGALWLFKFGPGSNLSNKADKKAYLARARREFAAYKPIDGGHSGGSKRRRRKLTRRQKTGHRGKTRRV